MDLRKKFLGKLENENFHSADGRQDFYAEGNADNWNADAAAQGSPSQPSQPMIVTLTNGTASPIANVNFLDAINSTKAGASNNGVTAGVTATYDLPGYDYAQFLQWLKGTPSRIFMITTVSDTPSNLRQSYKVFTYNLSGDDFSKTIFPMKNTFQQATDQFDTKIDFYMTGTTRITLTSIAGSSSITFYFFPFKIASSIGSLDMGGRTFANPNISGMQVIGDKQAVKVQ